MYLKSFNEVRMDNPPKPRTYLKPEPTYIRPDYRGAEKLMKKVAVIAGCDADIGRSTAIHFAREGAHLVILCREEDHCARYTKHLVEAEGRACLLIKGDIRDPRFQRNAIQKILQQFGTIDILVNNMAVALPQDGQETMTLCEMNTNLSLNWLDYLEFTKKVLPYLRKSGCVINTSAVTFSAAADQVNASVKAFTDLLAKRLSLKKIRVNGVVSGATSRPSGQFTRGGMAMTDSIEPATVGPVFVFLASNDAAQISGQVLQVNDQPVYAA